MDSVLRVSPKVIQSNVADECVMSTTFSHNIKLIRKNDILLKLIFINFIYLGRIDKINKCQF